MAQRRILVAHGSIKVAKGRKLVANGRIKVACKRILIMPRGRILRG